MRPERASPPRDERQRARAEAAAWVVRLHGPQRSPAMEAGFRDWLAAHPEHRRQFERVTEVWDAGAVPVPGLPRVAPAPASAATRRMVAAMLALVVALGGWALARWSDPAYVTPIGEQRVVRLSDGSRIWLNSGSRVDVAYGAGTRRVRIERGEAFFEVAKDASRPFLVQAGDFRVVALGTAFNVRYEPGRAAVTLVEGKVEVSGPRAASAPGTDIVLVPGQRVVVADAAPARIDRPQLDTITAWRRGEVVLDGTRLADAAAEMNRYDHTRLVIDDPAVADLRISGLYHSGDNAGFARMIARLHRLQAVSEGDRIRLDASPAPVRR